ncbi:hypothetical protein ACT7DA_13705 [Bacillus pacificus]
MIAGVLKKSIVVMIGGNLKEKHHCDDDWSSQKKRCNDDWSSQKKRCNDDWWKSKEKCHCDDD